MQNEKHYVVTIRYSLAALCDLWNELSDIPVTDDGHLEEGFLFFPVGADREDVWRWFESVNPDFKAGEAGGFIGEGHPYRQYPCSSCGTDVPSVYGCPDGAELCEACFDSAQH